MRNIIKRIGRYISTFKDKSIPNDLKEDDSYLVSYPKSGNTWVRHLIADATSVHLNLDLVIGEDNLNYLVTYSPRDKEVINNEFYKKITDSNLKRVIKSHDKYKSAYPNVIYLIRDPKDVMASFYPYSVHRTKNFTGSFSSFIRDEKYGLRQWFEHVNSWYNVWSLLVFYEQLLNEPIDEVKKILEFLGIYDLKSKQIEKIVERNTINALRKKNPSAQTNENYNFFRKGKTGDWKNHFSEEDIQYFNGLLEEYVQDMPFLKRYST